MNQKGHFRMLVWQLQSATELTAWPFGRAQVNPDNKHCLSEEDSIHPINGVKWDEEDFFYTTSPNGSITKDNIDIFIKVVKRMFPDVKDEPGKYREL